MEVLIAGSWISVYGLSDWVDVLFGSCVVVMVSQKIGE